MHELMIYRHMNASWSLNDLNVVGKKVVTMDGIHKITINVTKLMGTVEL